MITADNADQIRAKAIVEGANGPVTPTADEILEENGVAVIPDVLANAGGVVVSYFEWVQGLQEYFWKEAEVNAKLNEIVSKAFEETWRTAETAEREPAARRVRARRRARRGGDRHAGDLPVVTLYHAEGCHLCDRAREQLEELRAELGFALEEVDIDGRPRARGALPRVAPGRRDRRRAGLHLPRPSGRAPPPSRRTNSGLAGTVSGDFVRLAECVLCHKLRREERVWRIV